MARPFTTPPGVPTERLDALRTGMRAAAADPAMLADGFEDRNPVTYVAPDEIAAVMQRAYSTKPEMLQQRQQALTR